MQDKSHAKTPFGKAKMLYLVLKYLKNFRLRRAKRNGHADYRTDKASALRGDGLTRPKKQKYSTQMD